MGIIIQPFYAWSFFYLWNIYLSISRFVINCWLIVREWLCETHWRYTDLIRIIYYYTSTTNFLYNSERITYKYKQTSAHFLLPDTRRRCIYNEVIEIMYHIGFLFSLLLILTLHQRLLVPIRLYIYRWKKLNAPKLPVKQSGWCVFSPPLLVLYNARDVIITPVCLVKISTV